MAFRKYGLENFSFEIIEECSILELDYKEINWIKFYNSKISGYNLTDGGGGSYHAIKISNENILIIYDMLLNSDLTQSEIARLFSVGEDTISEINQGKTRISEKYIYPIRKNHIKHKCQICDKTVSYSSILCSNCNNKKSRQVKRPLRNTLKNLIRNIPFVQIAKQFEVSDNSIRKWCISEKLPYKYNEIKAYSNEEWELI